MLLQQLKLNNIRSYLNETIDFPAGSTLLSGDIGSGKSTLLLALEFALFGTARPDLPGEALLRKGQTQGSVELTFDLKGNKVTIRRNLKKEREAVKQTTGYIIINDVKKDLTPLELKSEIISLLGYPEEFLTKNKNYIFRYTVYTPQEEMKFILQEDPEIRQNVLRKIFNIDKYKNIRDNLQFYLKQLRTRTAILETKLENFEEQKNEFIIIEEKKKELAKELALVLPRYLKERRGIKEHQEEINRLEEEQKNYVELINQQRTALTLIEEKNRQAEQLQKKSEQLKREISGFSLPEKRTEEIKEEIRRLEREKNEFLKKKTTLNLLIKQQQPRIKENQEQLSKFSEEVKKIPEKESLKELLTKEIGIKKELQEKNKQIENLLEKTSQLITKNETLLQQSKELCEKIITLDKCPTCLQEVNTKHKEDISREENQKIRRAENILAESKSKRTEIIQQKIKTDFDLEQLSAKEKLLARTEMELGQLEQAKRRLEETKQKLKLLQQDNHRLTKQKESLEKEDLISNLERELNKLQLMLNQISKKEFLERQVKETEREILQNQERLFQLKGLLTQKEEELRGKADLTLPLKEKKMILEELNQKERELAVKRAELETNLNLLEKQGKQYREKIEKLTQEKSKLLRVKEIYYWLEEYLLNLTYTIEKQVMVNIHHSFNQLFQEWFSILIDDENVYSRLDDSFTPVIELNGYEISFTNLSGGEKTSAALAYRLALNRVINDVIHEIKTKDLLILDEPTDGFSSEQLDKVREVLERLNLKQTIIVSHESKIEGFVEKVIRISKEGQESHILD